MSTDSTIDRWGVVQLYSAAIRKRSWIEAISLGYTLLEMALRYLMASKAGPNRRRLSDSQINKCRYLIEFAKLAHKEGFLPETILLKISNFNDTRRRAIHDLLSGDVKLSEIAQAANQAGSLYGEIQALWLPITIGPEEPSPFK